MLDFNNGREKIEYTTVTSADFNRYATKGSPWDGSPFTEYYPWLSDLIAREIISVSHLKEFDYAVFEVKTTNQGTVHAYPGDVISYNNETGTIAVSENSKIID